MNFFDYVKLIQLGWDPAPPESNWPSMRKALLELAATHRAAAQIAEGARLEEYVKRTDGLYDYKENANAGPVE